MKKTKLHTRYKIKKALIPGVTTIIGSQLGWNKQPLIAWARREAIAGNDPTKVRDKAAEIGTLCHLLIKRHIANALTKNLDIDDVIDGYADIYGEYSASAITRGKTAYLAFMDWENENNPRYMQNEVVVIHKRYRYGGTFDLLAKVNDKITLIDFKTGNGFYPEYIIQLAAYYNALPATLKRKTTAWQILQIDKDTGDFHLHNITNKSIDDGWRAFKYLRRLYDLQKMMK